MLEFPRETVTARFDSHDLRFRHHISYNKLGESVVIKAVYPNISNAPPSPTKLFSSVYHLATGSTTISTSTIMPSSVMATSVVTSVMAPVMTSVMTSVMRVTV
jgi:hypothetical protein